jgi:hypothetical protein
VSPFPEATIYAYTFEWNNFRKTTLTNYTPAVIPNTAQPIYQKYLSPEHRTKIDVQEITVGANSKSSTDPNPTK